VYETSRPVHLQRAHQITPKKMTKNMRICTDPNTKVVNIVYLSIAAGWAHALPYV